MDSETKNSIEYLENTYVILNDPKKFPESSLPNNGRCEECLDDPFVKLNNFGHSTRYAVSYGKMNGESGNE